jgi:hypothetical protein
MRPLLGWGIIVIGFWALSAALMWPAFTLLRRRRRTSATMLLGYAAASAACGFLVFFLIPIAVHGLLGRVAP